MLGPVPALAAHRYRSRRPRTSKNRQLLHDLISHTSLITESAFRVSSFASVLACGISASRSRIRCRNRCGIPRDESSSVRCRFRNGGSRSPAARARARSSSLSSCFRDFLKARAPDSLAFFPGALAIAADWLVVGVGVLFVVGFFFFGVFFFFFFFVQWVFAKLASSAFLFFCLFFFF
jgi:hypothetical protein